MTLHAAQLTVYDSAFEFTANNEGHFLLDLWMSHSKPSFTNRRENLNILYLKLGMHWEVERLSWEMQVMVE